MSQTSQTTMPVPVEPLAYSTPLQEVWVIVLRAVTIAAGVWAALTLFNSACQIGLSFVQPHVSFGAGVGIKDPREILGLIVEGIADLAAVFALVAAVLASARRPGRRGKLVAGVVAMAATTALQWMLRTGILFWTGPGFLRELGGGGTLLYLLYTFGGLLRALLLPVLLIWVLSRSVIRQQYEGTVSLG